MKQNMDVLLLQVTRSIANDPLVKLSSLSSNTGICRQRLQKLLKSNFGKDFRMLSRNCRFCRSLNFLASGQSIKRVAYDCGYGYPENYTRAFKRRFGKSPSTFIEQKTAISHESPLITKMIGDFACLLGYGSVDCPQKNIHTKQNRILGTNQQVFDGFNSCRFGATPN